MGNKHPHRVRIVRIDVEDVRLAQGVGQQQIVLAAVPFASDPADAIHQAQCRELRNDEVLGTLAVEFHEVDLVDSKVDYLRPELFDGQRLP